MNATVFNVDENGLAIEGYDPVAYFTLGAATPGLPDITAQHNGVRFRFALETHRDLFVTSPEKYLPAFGAWCAWAAAGGSLAAIDPTAFVIHEDRLFLNFNNRLNRKFARNLKENIGKADRNWPDLSKRASEQQV